MKEPINDHRAYAIRHVYAAIASIDDALAEIKAEAEVESLTKELEKARKDHEFTKRELESARLKLHRVEHEVETLRRVEHLGLSRPGAGRKARR